MSDVGTITSRQVCPICKQRGPYVEDRRGELVCHCGGSRPDLLDVTLYVRSKAGKWRKERITRDNLGRRIVGARHARRVLELIRSQHDEGSFNIEAWRAGRANRHLWPNYVDYFLSRERARLLAVGKEATWHKYRSQGRYLREAWVCNVKAVNSVMCRDYLHKPCLWLALSPKSINDLAGLLRQLLRFAAAEGVITAPPEVPPVDVPERPIHWYSAAQQDAILEAIEEDAFRDLLQFGRHHGLRINELCALCWDQIFEDAGAFVLTRNFSRRKLVERTKTKKVKALPILDVDQEILARARANYAQTDRLPAGRLPVFRNPAAHPSKNPDGFFLEEYVRSRFNQAVESSGQPKIGAEEFLRHSFAMQHLNAGLDEATVARLLTHTSTAHVKRYAAHLVGSLKNAQQAAAPHIKHLKRK